MLSTNCDVMANEMVRIGVLHCFKRIIMAMIMLIVMLIIIKIPIIVKIIIIMNILKNDNTNIGAVRNRCTNGL